MIVFLLLAIWFHGQQPTQVGAFRVPTLEACEQMAETFRTHTAADPSVSGSRAQCVVFNPAEST